MFEKESKADGENGDDSRQKPVDMVEEEAFNLKFGIGVIVPDSLTPSKTIPTLLNGTSLEGKVLLAL